MSDAHRQQDSYYLVRNPRGKGVKKAMATAGGDSPPRPNQFVCDICSARLASRGSLYNHRKTHTERESHVCTEPDCDFESPYKSSLQRHVRSVHEEERDFSCTQCRSRFTTKAHLQTHQTTVHTKMPQFICANCWKMFTDKANWHAHMRRYPDHNIYSCDTCGKRCTTPEELEAHQRVKGHD